MRFPLPFALALVLGGLTPPARLLAQPKLPNLAPDLMAPTDALSPADERKQFTVPAGFEVQLVASEPDIQKPIQMAFDAKGRLWVTTSYHYPFAAPGKPTDKLFILSDFDPKTGKAGKVQTFAEDLNIPIGILPLPDCNSCIVSSLGEIRKYTDTKGTGKADKVEVLFTGFGTKDTHGMYNSFTLMPDGWVYACHGFSNDSTVKGKDGHEVKMQSGNTFRFRPDGSRIEIFTRGQVNPFGMAVDPWFNLYTADCHSKPITQLVPGAVYQSFGKPHDGLGYTPHITHHDHGSTALCGLAWYDADHFPKEYLSTMFLGNVVTNRINFDKITWKGSTPVATEQPDFMVSKDRWFRPVDIKLGADGALYVADFYNKIIGHYEVDLKDPRRDKDRGRIWRIVWKGKGEPGASAPGVAAPKNHRADFTKATDEELFDDLFHPNLTVRFFAGHQLRQRMAEGKEVKPGDTFATKLLAVPDRMASAVGWMMFILEAGKEPVKASEYEMFAKFGKDKKLPPEQLTGQIVRALSSRPKWGKEERAILLDIFKSFDSPHLTRAAVEAAGFHPHADFVAPLVAVLKKCPAEDVMLKQAAKIALRNCFLADPAAFAKKQGVDEKTDVILAESLLGACSTASADLLADIAKARDLGALLPGVAEFVGRYAELEARTRFATTLRLVGGKNDVRDAELLARMLRGLQARGAKLGPNEAKPIIDAVGKVLDNFNHGAPGPRDEFPPAAVASARAVLPLVHALPAVTDATTYTPGQRDLLASYLGTALEHTRAPLDLRLACADAQVVASGGVALSTLRLMTNEKDTPDALRERLLIAAAGSSMKDSRLIARDAIQTAPYRVAVSMGLNFASTSAGAELLFAAVKEGKAPARLLQEKAVLERLKASNAPGWEKTVAELTKGLPPADQRLADVLKKRAAGFASAKTDKVEGAKLFTKHCAACHKIADVGGKIAPQLDGIGLRGLERLFEDVLDPNRNVDQAFRARVITTSDDRTITALMLRVEGEVLVVADLEGKEKRIPLKDITLNRETLLSAMPANFDTAVPEADMYHIIAYLLDQKKVDPPKK